METVIAEVKGFYKIIAFSTFRKTKGVSFDMIPLDQLSHISALDRVLHENGAISPEPVGDVKKTWYMHPNQDDNLIVLYGTREVDIYNSDYGVVEHFTVTPNTLHKNGELIYTGGCMLVWQRKVFHRIVSCDKGSASINLATHYEGFDIDTNFNIYDLNTDTGDFTILKKGRDNQF